MYMAVIIETPLFSGPAAVLLKLVTEKEVDIWELCLKDIVDTYRAEIEEPNLLNLEEATELLMIVSILIKLKSSWLLPNKVEEEEDELPDGVFDLLIARMLECKTFKAVSQEFERLRNEADRSLSRQYGLDQKFLELMPDLLVNVEAKDLQAAFIRATTPKKANTLSLHHFSPITRTVPETIDQMTSTLSHLKVATFKVLTEKEDRIGIVFCFLAILELYKRGMVEITQSSAFGEIQVEWIFD